MKILLLAHGEKMELLVQFCAARYDILRQHELFAPSDTAELIERAMGAHVNRLLNLFHGGYQLISSYLSYNEIDLLIFFRNTSLAAKTDEDEMHILYLCDRYGIPLATNVATAELLIQMTRH